MVNFGCVHLKFPVVKSNGTVFVTLAHFWPKIKRYLEHVSDRENRVVGRLSGFDPIEFVFPVGTAKNKSESPGVGRVTCDEWDLRDWKVVEDGLKRILNDFKSGSRFLRHSSRPWSLGRRSRCSVWCAVCVSRRLWRPLSPVSSLQHTSHRRVLPQRPVRRWTSLWSQYHCLENGMGRSMEHSLKTTTRKQSGKISGLLFSLADERFSMERRDFGDPVGLGLMVPFSDVSDRLSFIFCCATIFLEIGL